LGTGSGTPEWRLRWGEWRRGPLAVHAAARSRPFPAPHRSSGSLRRRTPGLRSSSSWTDADPRTSRTLGGQAFSSIVPRGAVGPRIGESGRNCRLQEGLGDGVVEKGQVALMSGHNACSCPAAPKRARLTAGSTEVKGGTGRSQHRWSARSCLALTWRPSASWPPTSSLTSAQTAPGPERYVRHSLEAVISPKTSACSRAP
jgi:hypothetical protein